MTEILYTFSVISPYSYLAGNRLETLAAKHGATIVYRPVDIMRVFMETGGVAVKDRHWSRQEYRLQDLARSAAMADLPLTLKPAFWPADQAPASAALIAAQTLGFSVGAAAQACLRAVWAEEKNIADPGVVAAALEGAGVAAAALEPELDAARATFTANTDAAIAAGVFGAPFYAVGDQRFWGADRLPHLDAHLTALAEEAA